jgi:antitoxin VapB
MALNIKSAEAHRMARAVSDRTGETLTEVVTEALRRRLTALEAKQGGDLLEAEIHEIQRFVASLPDRDLRPPDEILGYDEAGLPS